MTSCIKFHYNSTVFIFLWLKKFAYRGTPRFKCATVTKNERVPQHFIVGMSKAIKRLLNRFCFCEVMKVHCSELQFARLVFKQVC